jgi:hypothetical protein
MAKLQTRLTKCCPEEKKIMAILQTRLTKCCPEGFFHVNSDVGTKILAAFDFKNPRRQTRVTKCCIEFFIFYLFFFLVVSIEVSTAP